jgi:hypothetical protein
VAGEVDNLFYVLKDSFRERVAVSAVTRIFEWKWEK